MILLFFISLPVFATPRQVPLLFAYQASLIDEGGSLLPDGFTDVNFKILDSIGTVLYEETQNTYLVKGLATVMIGNGLNPLNGSPTGGIPTSVLEPTDTKFLLVEVPGYKPYDKTEIVSAPFAIWADTALKMPDGSITGAMLGKGIITKEHLDPELLAAIFPNRIPKSMLPSDTLYGAEIQGSDGASKVGVNTSFIFSSSQTVQGVLKDLDIAINKRRQEIDYVQTSGTLNNTTITTPTIIGGTISNSTEISSPSIAPIGSIIPFYDFGGKATFNSNYWKYCDGSTHDFGGAIGVQVLPDLSGRYLVGFGTDGGKNLASASWDTAATGNVNHRINISHSHTTASHAHTLSAHTHDLSNHNHFMLGHTHSISSDSHFHDLATHQGDGDFEDSDNNGYTKAYVHNHGGSTGISNLPSTGSPSVNNSGGPSTDQTSTVNLNSDSSLSASQLIQPMSLRVRYIMRVK